MTKWLLGVASLGIGLGLVVACSGGDDNDGPCKIGRLGCYCHDDDTCYGTLECLPDLGICANTGSGIGGAPGWGEAGAGSGIDEGGAGSNVPPGDAGADQGGTRNQSGTGGSISPGGSAGTSGGGSSSGSGGSGGSTTNPFPDNPVGCAMVTSCPSCCETVGVYALDTFANDATLSYVKSFDVTATSATADYDLFTGDEIGAIFFRFNAPQNINSLSIFGTGTGGSLEIALVRAGGLDGCIYPVVSGTLQPAPDTCWGLGAGPYAALPADQIEVRVRSALGGRAALNITAVQYGP